MNQLAGMSYDAAGHQLTLNAEALSYDAENRLVRVAEPPSLGGAYENYVYDGQGQRVQRVGPTEAVVYVYDALGQLAAEYSSLPARLAACQTCYLSTDHLGSVRLVTDATANLIARHDYLPFGDELPGGVAGTDLRGTITLERL